MKKITILVLHLGFGGVEKAVTSLANLLCNKYDITIVATYKLEDKPAFKVDPKVHIKYLIDSNLPKKVENYKLLLFRCRLIKLWKELWRDYLRKGHFITLFKEGFAGISMYHSRKEEMTKYIKACDSDIIISTRDIHNELLSKYGREEALKIGWEHNHHNNKEKYSTKIIETAKNLDYLVLVSHELYDFYDKKLKEHHCRAVYIPNFIDSIPKVKSDVAENKIVTIGRLSKEKGHKDLIEVMHLVNHVMEDWHLDIIGEGPEREVIQTEIGKYDLRSKIKLHGFLNKEEQEPILKKSSVFVLSSYTESFGLVILEAFSYGIPTISFDSAQGAREIIKDNWDGYLIQDRNKQKMAGRIIELLRSYNRRSIMGNNALKKAKKYTGSQVEKDWVNLLESKK